MKKRYVWCSENEKLMLVDKDGQLVEDKSEKKPFSREKILSLSIFRNDKISGDGWKPHYNESLGGWIETRGQYDAACKANGLECAGNEGPPQEIVIDDSETKFTDNDIKDLKEKDKVELSDSDANYLKAL